MARSEVTDKKPATDELPSKPPRMALSIPEFSEAAGFSPSMYYKMKRQGQTPREMKVGTRTLISMEAAPEWFAERQADTASAKMKAKPVPPVPPAVRPPARPVPSKSKPARRATRRAEEANA